MSERRLMSVQSDLVRETIVNAVCERVRAGVERDLPEPVAAVLERAARPDLARAGYFTRVAEAELFEPARQPAAWIGDELRALANAESPGPTAVSELAARLADREPSERPHPDDPDAVTWRVPGPGGHVRHYVALSLLGGGADPDLKRDVVYGFVVRCCEEVIASPDLYVYNT